ncbi:metal-dependent hydrolase family protein [Stenotrophobium rhamnosiphilum]|uniref:Amidohydrolase family protein n=1 Tax=Stenotrophobium rhamnosiphilum TaxID=2029166 RepID=A0A2T5MKI5_9GAMM|nr:amidohydrolase family protein [Stenotrophobium rhamnosiphilum]PTU33091.1 amidohydrolase family protein [Stenotrophobium rhamnosiphilum]
MSYVLLENARLFDGVSPTIREGVSVLIDGNRIVEVSESKIQVENADRIDCQGKTLMPGMIDAHVHIYAESLKFGSPEPPITYRAQYAQKFMRHILGCGFTSIRDVAGGDHGMAMALRDGFFVGPRYYYGGLCLSQTGGHGDLRQNYASASFCDCGATHNFLAVIADGVDECIKAVREELRKGANHIKIMASGGVLSPSDPLERCQYSDAEIRAIVEECDRRGAYVAAHCHTDKSIRRCVELGVRTIEHGTLIEEETAQFVAERGAFVVPTMATIFALKDEGKSFGIDAVSYEKLCRVADSAMDGLAVMKKAGVKMGFGSDLIGPMHVRQGTEFTLRRNMLSAWDILHSATVVNAEIIGMAGQLGAVMRGYLADLLLVDDNPLDNIDLLAANGAHLSLIMVDGKFIKRTI